MITDFAKPIPQTESPVWRDTISLRPFYTEPEFLRNRDIKLLVLDKDTMYSDDKVLGVATVSLSGAINEPYEFKAYIHAFDQFCGIIRGRVVVEKKAPEEAPPIPVVTTQEATERVPPPLPPHDYEKEKGSIFSGFVNEWTQSLVEMVAPTSPAPTRSAESGNKGNLISFDDPPPSATVLPPVPSRDSAVYQAYATQQQSPTVSPHSPQPAPTQPPQPPRNSLFGFSVDDLLS